MSESIVLPAGFSLIQSSMLEEINIKLIQFKHERTGARFVHLECDDSNNMFGVAFKTPPEDSSGIAHILEHTALCGSKNYPVRDPFFSMLKRSLNSFMNAFTSSDWTCYPFSSQNRKDFSNLLGIYLDAAFFPLLRKQDFAQEGHRLEFSEPGNPNSALEFKGVVYNEMKGAMADPASLLGRRITKHLYPTTCYRHNSGGEPENIPDLTWEELKRFHARYYHPSNACFFTYGNFPLHTHLERIDQHVLQYFDAINVNSEVPPEPHKDQPLVVQETFPLDPSEDTAGKTMVHTAWLTNDISDSYTRLCMTLLSQLLLGNPGAPLYKALLDSGLGKNLTPGCGYQDDYRTTCFAVGLQGTEPQQVEAIQTLITDTLKSIAAQGFSRERIDAAIHRMELSNREVCGGAYPYPITLLLRILGPWLHCDDPVSALKFDANFERLRADVDAGGFFEGLIQRWLLDNKHRVTLCLRPDPEQGQREQEQERLRLEKIKAALNPEQRQSLLEQAQLLQQNQDQIEDLSCLPDLEMEDIDPTEPRVETAACPVELLCFAQPTNGLSYVDIYFPCAHLDAELVAYVPLFCSMLTQVGTTRYDYVKMAERMEAKTGGISFGASVINDIENLDKASAWIRVRAKALARNVGPMCALLTELCTEADFSDTQRLATVIGQIKSSIENAIPGSGHSFAAQAGAAHLTPAAHMREQWGGLTQLQHIKHLAAIPQEQLGATAAILARLRIQLFERNAMRAGITAEAEHLDNTAAALTSFIATLPHGTPHVAKKLATFTPQAAELGWATSIPVSYVTRSFRTVPYCHPDAAVLNVLAALLRANFLHREIREKGGAYGGMASNSSDGGIFAMLSYRDPHLERTLQVYEQALEWVKKGEFGAQEIKEAVLSVFSSRDRPQSPSGKGAAEFACVLQGVSYALRQEFRTNLLKVTRDDLIRVAKTYLSPSHGTMARSPEAISIISSEEKLRSSAATLSQLEIKRI
ncbi:MAG: insulinase family protein [Desulfuromonadaceae bacterium]|nr:insulinase family protein [Desulfuromonadaceae bacterium]